MPLDQPAAHPFDNTYARLPDRFFARLSPTPVTAPRVLRLNEALARQLRLDPAALDADVLSGNRLLPGAEPLAQAYAGHQFGGFSPQLGDGRAILLGEVLGLDGRRYDIQLKGSGRTPFSRGGDGRAALGPVLREFLLGEAMHGLGIPTTRALAAVATGETVLREAALPGAILVRVAASHLRVGTFQFFAARGDEAAVRALADYAIARHYPGLEGDYPGFLGAVAERQARLIAQWLLVGFVHGVMNTDNTAISGETIDYGPCAFMESYDPATVFSSIDLGGRYAYGNQPRIAGWNLARLAEALLSLTGLEAAQEALAGFGAAFETAYHAGLNAKLGLPGAAPEPLGEALLGHMQAAGADWTATFRALTDGAVLFPEWHREWSARAPDLAAMGRANPVYIPRNHLVEAALAAAGAGDLGPFDQLREAVARPYERRAGLERFERPARPEERVSATFCGT